MIILIATLFNSNTTVIQTGNVDTTCGEGTYFPLEKSYVPKETKEQKRTRLALEKNRASWFVFDQPLPTIKLVKKVGFNKQIYN